MSMTITLKPDIEESLRRDALAFGLAPEEIAAQRLEEAELTRQIDALSLPHPPHSDRRYRDLLRKRRAGTLTEPERQEMISYSDDSERRAVERLELLVRLSRLWNHSLPDTTKRLGIKPPKPI